MSNKIVPTDPNGNMINAGMAALEPFGISEGKRARLVADIYNAMLEVAPPQRTSGLTPRMKQVLEIIYEYVQEHGTSPRYSDIGDQMGKGKGEISQIVRSMKRRGALDIVTGPRGIRLLMKPGDPLPTPKLRY